MYIVLSNIGPHSGGVQRKGRTPESGGPSSTGDELRPARGPPSHADWLCITCAVTALSVLAPAQLGWQSGACERHWPPGLTLAPGYQWSGKLHLTCKLAPQSNFFPLPPLLPLRARPQSLDAQPSTTNQRPLSSSSKNPGQRKQNLTVLLSSSYRQQIVKMVSHLR